MSEYQYYEFQAIDRPLDRAAQDALRSISSRARITATSFTNHYEWGDLKGDPRKFMERWFDLHLYLANWSTRRLMLRVPKRFVNHTDIEPFRQPRSRRAQEQNSQEELGASRTPHGRHVANAGEGDSGGTGTCRGRAP
jgi:hypothetical protein